MKKEKTAFTYNVQWDVNVANQIIGNWLQANDFKYETHDGKICYVVKSFMTGNKYFEYYFDGKTIYMYAYLGKYNRPYGLGDGNKSCNGAVKLYHKILKILFNALYYSDNIQQQNIGCDGVFRQPVNPLVSVEQIKDEVGKLVINNAVVGLVLSFAATALILAKLIAFGWLIYVLIIGLVAPARSTKYKWITYLTYGVLGLNIVLTMAFIASGDFVPISDINKY